MNTATLSDLKEGVLQTTERYQIVTLSLLKTRIQGAGEPAAELKKAGYLELIYLYDFEWAYQLTKLATSERGIAAELCQPINRHDLKKRYAMLRYCQADTSRIALTEADFKDHPEYEYPGIDHRSYYQTGNSLGKLLVDCGNDTAWGRLRKRWIESALKIHKPRPAYAELINANRFEVAMVTPHQEKAATLSRITQENELFEQVPLRVLLVPELAAF